MKNKKEASTYDKGPHCVPGLHLRSFPCGRKTWFFRYKSPTTNRIRRPKLANASCVSLSDARVMAKKLYLSVANGLDPMAAAPTDISNLDALFAYTLERHWGPKTKYGKEVINIWQNCVSPTLGKLAPKSASPKIIKDWHQSLAHKPNLANRAKSVLSKCFSMGILDGALDLAHNPCGLVPNHRERQRTRFATPEELAALGAILERLRADALARNDLKTLRQVTYLYLLVFTGTRPSALEKAKWRDITWAHGVGILNFEGKTGFEQVILPPQVHGMLLDILPDEQNGPLLGIKMPRRLWARIQQEIGAKSLWARDCRRTFATLARSSGLGMDKIAGLLNHKTQSTTQRYAKLLPEDNINSALAVAKLVEKALKPES